MPLREVLQNFLDHVGELDRKYQQREDVYEAEFQNLKALTEELRTLPQYSCSQGEQDVNRRKNRYKDILPYDGNRVILGEVASSPGSTYINASFIKGASGSTAYIASQAPLPHTVDDFWRMIWEWEVQVVVMASNEIEGGRQKCVRYWPTEGETLQFGEISVSLVGERAMGSDYTVKELSARSADVTRTIHHFHYQTWPDHGVPLAVQPIIEMVGFVRKFQVSETLPVLVHCSAGCGRTGTVCAIDFVWGLLRAGKLHKDFSLKQLIFDMRKQRIAMVQTKEQYVLVHRAVKELFEEHLKVIDNHPYENIDFSGRPLILNEDPDYESIKIDPKDSESRSTSISGDGSAPNASGDASGSSEKQSKRSQRHQDSPAAPASCDSDGGRPAAPLPPLPTKTRVGQHQQLVGSGGGDGARDREEPSSGSPCGSNGGDRDDSPPVEGADRHHHHDEDKSRMDYVSNWCNGLASGVGAGKGDETTLGDSSHSDLAGVVRDNSLVSESRLMSDSKATLASEDSGPALTSSNRPSSSSPSPSGGGGQQQQPQQQPPARTRKNRFQKRSTPPEPDDRIKVSRLVRKPSIAKLKALFETDSSGPPSPDPGYERDTASPLKSTKPGSTTGSTTTDLSSSATDFNAASSTNTTSNVPGGGSGGGAGETTEQGDGDDRRRKRGRKLYVDRCEFEAATERYVDTALRIFSEFRRSSVNLAESKVSESYRVLSSSPVPAADGWHGDGQTPPPSSNANASASARISSSTVSLSSASSPQEERRRSHSSHSPSPGAGDSTSGATASGGSGESGVAQQAKELVGRFRRARRNSSSAEKRPASTLSTWYDGEDATTTQATSVIAIEQPTKDLVPASPSLSAAANRKQNRVAQLLFGGGSLEKKSGARKNVDKLGVAVKRSISMKVGFRSPLVRRKSGGGGVTAGAGGGSSSGATNDNVAAYLGVEEGKRRSRVLGGPRQQHHHHHHRLSGGIQPVPMLDGDTVVLVGPKNYVRRMQGYVNSPRPLTPADTVQLTNFRQQSEEIGGRHSPATTERKSSSPVRRVLDPAHQQRQRPLKMGMIGDERTPEILAGREDGTGGASPYCSPGPPHRRNRESGGASSPSPSLRACAPSPSHLLANERCRSRSNSPRAMFLVEQQSRHDGDVIRRHSRDDLPQRHLPTVIATTAGTSSPVTEHRTRSPQLASAASSSSANCSTSRLGVDRVVDRSDCVVERGCSPSQTATVESRSRGYPTSSRGPDGSRRHNFFGSEMDDYCQQIIQDCQEYLVHHNQPNQPSQPEYSNVTAEAQRNIRWIEETVLQSPRRAILDVTSSSENLAEPSAKQHQRGTNLEAAPGCSDYERLWFSRSGAVRRPSAAADDERDSVAAAATAANTSVEEVSMSFLGPEDDDDDESGGSGEDRDEGRRRAALLDDRHGSLSRPDQTSGMETSASGPHFLPKDVRFCRTVEELKSLIEELHVHEPAGKRTAAAGDVVRQRKPQPAPRTILNTVPLSTSAVPRRSERLRERDDRGPQGVAREDRLPNAAAVASIGERIYANCSPTVTLAPAQLREVRVEHATPLRSTSPRPREPVVGNNHTSDDNHYEVIRFHDEGHRRAAAREERGQHDRPPTESQYGVLLGRHRVPPAHLDGLSLTARAQGEIAATRLYGQVHKPRRRKQSPPPPLLEPDGLVSPSPPGIRPINEHDYEVLRGPPGWREQLAACEADEGGHGGGAGITPVAPPRVRRQPSTASNKFRADGALPPEQSGTKNNVPDREYLKEPWHVPREKWEAEFDDDDDVEVDDEDDSPPVPVKTKDAYRLPKNNVGTSGISASASAGVGANSSAINTSFDNVSSGSSSQASSSGLSITKALTKLHTNFFSKLGTKNNNNDKTEYDSSSVGSGSNTPPSSHIATTKNPSTTIGFPHRLESKPKGPRDPPAHWKVSAK